MARPDRIDFYFDYISPYAFLAWRRLGRFAERHGLPVEIHPVVFGALLDRWGQLGPAEVAPKRAHVFRDTLRRAALEGVTLRFPKTHPFNPITALRLSLREVAGDRQVRVVDALFDAGWVEGIDMAAPDDLYQALEHAGLDGPSLLERTRDPHVKQALREETDRAIGRGVFGVPTMLLGDELFWGADQFDLMELYLSGRDPLDRDRVSEILARPRGADRRREG